jgi:hypothetical protein
VPVVRKGRERYDILSRFYPMCGSWLKALQCTHENTSADHELSQAVTTPTWESEIRSKPTRTRKRGTIAESPADYVNTASFLTADFSDYETDSLPASTGGFSARRNASDFSQFGLNTMIYGSPNETDVSNSSSYLPMGEIFQPNPPSTSRPTLPYEQELEFTNSWWNDDVLPPADSYPNILAADFSSTILETQDWNIDTTWTTSFSAEVPIDTTANQPSRGTRKATSARANLSGYSADLEEYDETYGSSDEVDSTCTDSDGFNSFR